MVVVVVVLDKRMDLDTLSHYHMDHPIPSYYVENGVVEAHLPNAVAVHEKDHSMRI